MKINSSDLKNLLDLMERKNISIPKLVELIENNNFQNEEFNIVSSACLNNNNFLKNNHSKHAFVSDYHIFQ